MNELLKELDAALSAKDDERITTTMMSLTFALHKGEKIVSGDLDGVGSELVSVLIACGLAAIAQQLAT